MSHVAYTTDNVIDTKVLIIKTNSLHMGKNTEIEQTLFFKKRIIASVTFFISAQSLVVSFYPPHEKDD